ncbi:hypothetical protein FHG87_011294 [Trinorchestia longiramus]|nr:hypothetical protein FHG87_011294 [Trinorchestia longiramus]
MRQFLFVLLLGAASAAQQLGGARHSTLGAAPTGYLLSGLTDTEDQARSNLEYVNDSDTRYLRGVTGYEPTDNTERYSSDRLGYQHRDGTEYQHADSTGYQHADGTEYQHADSTGYQHADGTEYQHADSTGYYPSDENVKKISNQSPLPETTLLTRVRRARRLTQEYYRHKKRRYMMGGKYRPYGKYRG